jgi:hypothetical protein
VDGLLKYLGAKEAQVRKTLSYKLIGYALGRTVMASDQLLIERMAKAGGDATFAQLAAEIATSKQFRNRRGREETPAAPVKSKVASNEGETVFRRPKTKGLKPTTYKFSLRRPD